MYNWQKAIAPTALLILCVVSNGDIKWKTYYITPLSNGSLIGCPFDHCYSLQDIFDNKSHFFASNTTLELLPGRYEITESVGQLVSTKVSNFRIEGVQKKVGTVIIECSRSATLGFTFVRSENIQISNIHFRHCSANLKSALDLVNDALLTSNITTMLSRHLENNFSSCILENHTLCYSLLVSFSNTEVSLYQTTITYSNGIGVLGLDNKFLFISNSTLAYNEVNCAIFVIDVLMTGTSFTMSDSYIFFGRTKKSNLASGLNLFVLINCKEQSHNISLTGVTLKNNRAKHGNFYLFVDIKTISTTFFDLTIWISDFTSIQSNNYMLMMSGIVVRCRVNLDYRTCVNSRSNRITSTKKFNKQRITIVFQKCSFIGSCATIHSYVMDYLTINFKMRNITIRESKCPVALTIAVGGHDFKLSDLTIMYSFNDIILFQNTFSTNIKLTGKTSFVSNNGSVLIMSNAGIVFRDAVNISNNTAQKFESVFQIKDSYSVFFQGQVTFINNSGRQGGALSADKSRLYFNGTATFIGNSAINGGAISLREGSVVYLMENTNIDFRVNKASIHGGAIFVDDTFLWFQKEITCFIQSYTTTIGVKENNITVKFENNTAKIAGAALYGGWIDICKTNHLPKPTDFLDFTEENSVSSTPSRVCICTNSTVDRHRNETQIEVFPGQTFDIELVAVGQRFGVVPATVRAESEFDTVDHLYEIQDTQNHCTKLNFTVRSSRRNETLGLSVDNWDLIEGIQNEGLAEFHQFKVVIYLNACPLGFVFDKKQNICLCQLYLLSHGVQCNFSSYTVNRNARQWIGLMPPTMNIVIHNHCPYDYCKSNALFLNLSISDEQCSFNRSGILCGRCQPELSHVLGTSNCKRCSNWWLLLTLVFALAGVALVAGLMLLNITVSTGTINGLIFYANIVRVNSAVFFPGERANTFLSLFIAWFNLDLGIETCFYDGLDAYVKTWLQLAFPLYIWFLVAVVIISCRHSKRASNLCGDNPVQVLATLFLLSYAKLLRVTITVFQPTHLLEHQKVWHYDGNIAYLGKRHAPLMLVALLLFVIFFIPYTLILFAIQWLQPFSHHKFFGWINQFKPLFDAYTGPYKDKHRYWTGLLLLVRIALFTVFSTNTSGDPAINLLAITVTIVCLFAYLALFAGVYKVCLLNILEYSFLLNLVIMSVGVLYATSVNNKPVHVVTQISVAISLSVTLIIMAYHSFNIVLKSFTLDDKVYNILLPWNKKYKTNKKLDTSEDNYIAALNCEVTHSSTELKEPLLEY